MNTQQLVKDCLKNNRQAQQSLYNEYAGNMLGLCYRYTKSIHDAEDILQEGFIKVFHNLHQYKNDGELGAWIRRIMVNTALTYIKKHSRYRDDDEIDGNNLHVLATNEPEIKMNTKDLIELIRKLPNSYQTIFNLVAIEGYSQIEIADMMQTNINTIRSQYSRGRGMLMKMVEEDSKAGGQVNKKSK